VHEVVEITAHPLINHSAKMIMGFNGARMCGNSLIVENKQIPRFFTSIFYPSPPAIVAKMRSMRELFSAYHDHFLQSLGRFVV